MTHSWWTLKLWPGPREPWLDHRTHSHFSVLCHTLHWGEVQRSSCCWAWRRCGAAHTCQTQWTPNTLTRTCLYPWHQPGTWRIYSTNQRLELYCVNQSEVSISTLFCFDSQESVGEGDLWLKCREPSDIENYDRGNYQQPVTQAHLKYIVKHLTFNIFKFFNILFSSFHLNEVIKIDISGRILNLDTPLIKLEIWWDNLFGRPSAEKCIKQRWIIFSSHVSSTLANTWLDSRNPPLLWWYNLDKNILLTFMTVILPTNFLRILLTDEGVLPDDTAGVDIIDIVPLTSTTSNTIEVGLEKEFVCVGVRLASSPGCWWFIRSPSWPIRQVPGPGWWIWWWGGIVSTKPDSTGGEGREMIVSSSIVDWC